MGPLHGDGAASRPIKSLREPWNFSRCHAAPWWDLSVLSQHPSEVCFNTPFEVRTIAWIVPERISMAAFHIYGASFQLPGESFKMLGFHVITTFVG